MYGKPKPSGRNGEIPRRFRPILLAKEIQRKIESDGGVQTSHDGFDDGQDDANLLKAVKEAAGDDGTSEVDEEEDSDLEDSDKEEDHEGDGPQTIEGMFQLESLANSTNDTCVRTLTANDILNMTDRAQVAAAPPPPVGTILTAHGPVNAALAAELDLSPFSTSATSEGGARTEVDWAGNAQQPPNSAEEGDKENHASANVADNTNLTQQGSSKTSKRVMENNASMNVAENANTAQQGSGKTSKRAARLAPRRGDKSQQPPTTAEETKSNRATSNTPRSVGRPRAGRRVPLETAASPDGPVLRRDPGRANEDSREALQHPLLNNASNRYMQCQQSNIHAGALKV